MMNQRDFIKIKNVTNNTCYSVSLGLYNNAKHCIQYLTLFMALTSSCNCSVVYPSDFISLNNSFNTEPFPDIIMCKTVLLAPSVGGSLVGLSV